MSAPSAARDAFRLAALAAATLAALAPAYAQEADLDPSKPVSSVGAGIGYVGGDPRRFGQYNGMNEDGAYGLLDLYMSRRDDATGTWTQLMGRNLGLDSRQLRFEQSRQGNWGYFLEYGRIPRFEPYTVTTGVSGIGSPNLTVPGTPTTGMSFDIKTQRDILGLGFDKNFGHLWDVKVRFRNEEKEGSRIFGRGTTGTPPLPTPAFPGNMDFTPEPIKSTTRQLDVILGYNGDKLQLSGGYYGTMFSNSYDALFINGGVPALSTPASTAFNPIGLPPDNSSHQLNLAGGYSFTPSTRGNFKLAYANAKQDDPFPIVAAQPTAPGVGSSLQGKVETTLVQAGIVSRPMPKLTLRADLRYEDRDDKTPVIQYITAPPTSSTGHNEPRSFNSAKGVVEASYQLPHQLRLTGGIENEEKNRNTSPVHIVSYRETTDEMSYRVELRRSMSETLTGAISYVHSDRDGSPFLPTTLSTGAVSSNLVAPITLADRKRDKLRFTSNWTPVEPLSLQFFVDYAEDQYSGLDGSGLGPRQGSAQNYSFDAAYRLSDRWKGSAWFNRYDTKAEQVSCEGITGPNCTASATNPIYSASLRNQSNSFGLGLRGEPNGVLSLGLDLSYSQIDDSYQQQALNPATSTDPQSLPEVTTRLVRLTFFAKYALAKNSSVRVDYIFDRYKTNDWTWTTWAFADGTTVSENPNQRVNYLGVSYNYRWQ